MFGHFGCELGPRVTGRSDVSSVWSASRTADSRGPPFSQPLGKRNCCASTHQVLGLAVSPSGHTPQTRRPTNDLPRPPRVSSSGGSTLPRPYSHFQPLLEVMVSIDGTCRTACVPTPYPPVHHLRVNFDGVDGSRRTTCVPPASLPINHVFVVVAAPAKR